MAPPYLIPNRKPIYITYIEKEVACLKVWGQTDRELPIAVEKALAHMMPIFERGDYIPLEDDLVNGMMVCAKFKDGLYYRAKISNTSLVHQGLVEVHFIDYGNREYVPLVNTRLMNDTLRHIVTIPPQAKDFIIGSVTHFGMVWDENILAQINAEIRYVDLYYQILSEVGLFKVIRLSTENNDDVAMDFVVRTLLLSLSPHTQEMMLLSYSKRIQQQQLQLKQQQQLEELPPPPPQNVTKVPPQIVPTPTLLNYKSLSLEAGSEHAVYVSYVSDGPLQFSVQLKRLEDTLAKLMNELDKMQLQPFEELVIPGTVCVARCIEDGYYCRAVVTSTVDSQYKVFFVDFGNTEVVPLYNLYQIPFKCVIPKVMAMRFQLAGLEKSNVTLEMKCAFKDFVCNKPLTMRVAPMLERCALPTCELWDENGVYALDVLRRAATLSYPDAMALTRGLSQDVHVSYVYSCSRFFVQLKSKADDLSRLMEVLQADYANGASLRAEDIKEGMPCCALFESDFHWYRAQVISNTPTEGIKVRYIDYGNEEIVPLHNLRKLQPEHVTTLKPQALECCLNGYQNMEQDKDRDNLLEELILEKDFSMKVFDTQENRVLVELFDSERYNVSSLLLEKIALKRAQVSPLLVQDGLKFDHRKRLSFDENGAKSSWGRKGGNERGGPKDAWRQAKFSPRTDDFNNQEEKSPNRPHTFKENTSRTRGGFRDNDYSNKSEEREGGGAGGSFRERRADGGGQRQGGFRERRERVNSDFDARNNDRSPQQHRERFGSTNSNESFGSGRSKKFDNKREGSEKSWSDSSEKNWKKTSNSSRNSNTRGDFKPKFGGGGNKRFDGKSSRNNSFNSRSSFNSGGDDKTPWNIEAVPDLPDLAPNDAVYENLQLTDGSESKVTVSWFHNPSHFYCQLLEMNDKLKTMMEDIQTTYVHRKSTTAVTVGAPVIAAFPEDNVLYRARILETQFNKYRVFYVDFGNTATVNEVYPIQRKFLELPAQAMNCCLRGVAPVEHEWGAVDNYAEYFGKDVFVCVFLGCENEQYLVDLTITETNENLANSLIEASLAQPDHPTATAQIESNILKGQQLRVTLTAITSLADFTVFVVPDLTLTCSAHNLSTATQTHENLLQDHLNQSMIIYVDDVLENQRLIVTLYDTHGYKVEILEPDEGAFESVEPLCPLPIFYATLYGWVSHVSAHSVFVQPTGFADTLAQLLEQLYQHYNETILEVPIIPEQDLVYAVRSGNDGNWYRARTVSVEEEMATFLYVDYGNCESVAITEVRELEVQFLDLHVLAVEVYVQNPTEALLEQNVTLKLHNNEGWYGEIIGQTDVTPPPPEEAAAKQEEPPLPSTTTTTEPQSLGTPVILTHFDTPSEFYLQLSEASETVQQLQRDLQAAIPTLADLENPSAGVLCAAPYSLDQLWYRAQVLDADADITTVRFVDYGNTDVLENGVTMVKTLTPELLMLEQHARRCSLNVAPVEEEWTPAALQRFEELTAQAVLVAEIISQDEKTTYIDLYTNGQSIADILINEQLAIKLTTVPEPLTATGFVSHLNSPSEFWMQLESSVADLEWIADQLSTAADTFPQLEDLTPGSLCAAVFPEDENWYRARILSNTVAGLEVLFIDYGNSCTCTRMRALPEELALMPAMAQKCSLQKPAEVEQWTPQACEKFKDLAADGVTIFHVKKLATGETAVVDLLLEGQSVGYLLLPKTVDCFVTQVESVESFHIRRHDEVDEVNTVCKLEPLVGVQWNEESNRIFCDLNQDGKTLFQVEFVTSDLVRLYIDGRDIRTDLGGIKTPTSSTTTSPKKYIDGGSKTETISTVDEELVVEIVENTNETDVKHILSNIVSDVTGETEVKEKVANVAEKSSSAQDDVKELLSDIVEGTTKTVAETQVKDALNEIIDQTVNVTEAEIVSDVTELESNNETEKLLPEEQEVLTGQNDSKESVSDKSELKTSSPKKTEESPKDSLNETNISDVQETEKIAISDLSSGSSDITKTEKLVQQKESSGEVLNESGASFNTLNVSTDTDVSETHETLKAVVNTLNDIIETAAAAGDNIASPPPSTSSIYDVEEKVVPGAISQPKSP